MTVVENKWLSGPYAPIPGDVTATDLEVVGTLPTELNGRYLRNGPNPITPVDPATHHWFMGDGMVHGVRLREGQADWYRARMVRSTAVWELLGEEPAPGERHGGFDGANTNVIGLAGKTLAIVEAGARPVELSYELDTVCHTDLERHPAERLHRAPEGRSRHRQAARGRVPLGAAAPAVHRDRDRRARGEGLPHRRHRRADGARLLDHRALDGRVRPARWSSTSRSR